MESGKALGILRAELRKLGYVGEIKGGAILGSDLPTEPLHIYLQEPEGDFVVHPDGHIEDEDGVLARIGKERAGLC